MDEIEEKYADIFKGKSSQAAKTLIIRKKKRSAKEIRKKLQCVKRDFGYREKAAFIQTLRSSYIILFR